MKIIKNQAKCKNCGKVLVSTDPDVYLYCTCGLIAVSGGNQAIMRLGHHKDIIEMSIKET